MSSGLGITFLTGTSISPTDYFAPIGGQYSGGPSRCHKTNTAVASNITKSQCATILLTAVSYLDHLTPCGLHPERVLIGIGLFGKLDSTSFLGSSRPVARSTSLPPTALIIVTLKIELSCQTAFAECVHFSEMMIDPSR